MRGVKAESFAANRTLLTGEAAHVFPPVGAQGLNMSLRDVGHAVDLILGADDPGSDAIIDAYCDARRGDVWPRQLAVSAVNTSLLSDTLVYDIARVAGLAAVGNIPALREYVLREGLAPSGNLPTSMLG